MKRMFDIVVSALGLIILSPVLLVFIFLIWKQDKRSPFYYSEVIGMNGKPFRMIKLRKGADKPVTDSALVKNGRMAVIMRDISGKIYGAVRLWNVLKGEMSLVGPRPKSKGETDLYTAEEKRLLSVRPGMTDMASVVFADKADLLRKSDDRNLAYHQIIRPWANRLGLVYIDKRSFAVDFKLIWVTAMAIFVRYEALDEIGDMLDDFRDDGVRGIDEDLIAIARRDKEPFAAPPPGAPQILQSHDIRTA